jgi:hypothetical protein
MMTSSTTARLSVILLGLVSISGMPAENPLHPTYRTSTWRKDMTRDFKVMDTTRDGKVDMAEWQSHTNPLHPEYAKNHAKPDRRKLSKQEMDSVWQALAGSDNVVTMDEFLAHSNPLHPQYERNHAKPGTVRK